MARVFVASSSEYLYLDTTVVTDQPHTLVCWARKPDTVREGVLLSLAAGSIDDDWDAIRVDTVEAVEARSRGNVNRAAVHGTAHPIDEWFHVCGVFAGNADRTIYLDGVDPVQNTSNCVQEAYDVIGVGAIPSATPEAFFTGYVAEAAIWNVALTAAEAAILAAGYSPLFVRPESLVFYAPLVRDDDNDLVGGISLSVGGTPTIETHPPIIYAPPPFLSYPVVAAGGDINVTVPVASIAITTYAPTVDITAHIDVTVPFASIAITTYAPTAAFPIDVEVPPASIAITTYAPTAAFTEHIDVEVPAASIAITTYAPTVEITAHIDVEVPPASIAITTYVPDVDITTGMDVEVPPASIAITTYAPTVAITAHIDVEVPPASIAITTYVPTVAFTEHIDVEVPAASIGISTYVPVAAFTEHIDVTVPAASIAISIFAPDVTITEHIDVEVPVASIVITTYVPDAAFEGDIDVEVPTANIGITTYVPGAAITTTPVPFEYRLRRTYRSPGLISEVPGTGITVVTLVPKNITTVSGSGGALNFDHDHNGTDIVVLVASRSDYYFSHVTVASMTIDALTPIEIASAEQWENNSLRRAVAAEIWRRSNVAEDEEVPIAITFDTSDIDISIAVAISLDKVSSGVIYEHNNNATETDVASVVNYDYQSIAFAVAAKRSGIPSINTGATLIHAQSIARFVFLTGLGTKEFSFNMTGEHALVAAAFNPDT